MDKHTAKAKATRKIASYGLEDRLRLAAKLERRGAPVSTEGIPSAEELADAVTEVVRNHWESSSASDEEAEEILEELEEMDIPTIEDGE